MGVVTSMSSFVVRRQMHGVVVVVAVVRSSLVFVRWSKSGFKPDSAKDYSSKRAVNQELEVESGSVEVLSVPRKPRAEGWQARSGW